VQLKRGAPVGRVVIPRLNITAVVRSGVDDKTLKRAVGHVPTTALPGRPGNVGLAAHRDTFFRNLRGVRKGDLIRMITPGGEYDYRVESTKIVTPKNVEVLNPTKENALTLVTCYPFNYVGSAPKRFIVRAKQIRRTEEAQSGGI
jgi:sortase A